SSRANQLEEVAHHAAAQAERLADLQQRLDHAHDHIATTDRMLSALADRLERERLTVLKPIYRRLYLLGGRTLRGLVPAPMVERIKRRVPVPGGIPRA
ncbi:MAG TPA: hypothetical protein PLL33_09395, partial [Paracoccus sp. (in: a-proteobacteria)]|nr:hypothetical protein [Paracoccus sp. (in: a-proteobacteria)]